MADDAKNDDIVYNTPSPVNARTPTPAPRKSGAGVPVSEIPDVGLRTPGSSEPIAPIQPAAPEPESVPDVGLLRPEARAREKEAAALAQRATLRPPEPSIPLVQSMPKAPGTAAVEVPNPPPAPPSPNLADDLDPIAPVFVPKGLTPSLSSAPAPSIASDTLPAGAPPAPIAQQGARPEIQPPTSPQAPRPTTFPQAGSDAMQGDIERILGSIKLPERRTPASAPKPKQEIPLTPIDDHLAKPAQVEQSAEAPVVTALHTLKDDIQNVVREEKISLVRAASLEEDRKIREQDEERQEHAGAQQRANRTWTVIVIAGLLIFLGFAALLGVFVVMNQQGAVPVQAGPSSLIFAEQNLLLPIDTASPGAIKQQVAQLRGAQVGSLGSITRIIPTVTTIAADGTQTTRPATATEFLKALGVSAPDGLTRALDSDFFFGVHSADKNAPVFIFTVRSYDNAFAGMLAWEQGMNADLAPIVTPLSPYFTDKDGVPQERRFSDAVIRNYDARTLSDDNGTIQLYYSFPSPSILVIAESPYTFAEVINRLRAQRLL